MQEKIEILKKYFSELKIKQDQKCARWDKIVRATHLTLPDLVELEKRGVIRQCKSIGMSIYELND